MKVSLTSVPLRLCVAQLAWVKAGNMERKMMTDNGWLKVTTVGEQLARAREGHVTQWLAKGIISAKAGYSRHLL